MILPFFVLTILSIAGFLLPNGSHERITFHVTILLAVTVFLLLIHDTLPPSSEFFPKIGIYFTITLLLTCLACFMSAVVLNLSLRSSRNLQEKNQKNNQEDSEQGSPQKDKNPKREQNLRKSQNDGGAFAKRLDWLFFAFYTLATILNTLAFLIVFIQD
jgi:hypothetical protein